MMQSWHIAPPCCWYRKIDFTFPSANRNERSIFILQKEKILKIFEDQITDKDLRTLVLRPLSYFTSIRISGIIEVQKEARRSADVYGKKRKAKQT